MCFVGFMIYSFPLFYMRITLVLSWWNSISSTAYPCPSIKYIDRRCCGKALYPPTILDSVDIVPFFFASAISLLSTLIPWKFSLQCAPFSLGVRQRTHQTTILWYSVCRTLVWVAYAGYLWCIWAPSQAFPSHTFLFSLMGYIGNQWPYWCLYWTLMWQISAMTLYSVTLLHAPSLVSSACLQA